MAQQVTALPDVGPVARGERALGDRLLRGALGFARRRKLGAVGAVLVFVVLVIALISPLIQRYGDQQEFRTPNPEFNPLANPLEIARNPNLSTPSITNRHESPSNDHWFGTDKSGRDIYARVIVGAR